MSRKGKRLRYDKPYFQSELKSKKFSWYVRDEDAENVTKAKNIKNQKRKKGKR